MSLVASRPRAAYRIYDADAFLAGGVGDDDAPAIRVRSTRARTAAAGLASAVLAALVAFTAYGDRSAQRRSPDQRRSSPLASASVPPTPTVQLGSARLVARARPRQIPAPTDVAAAHGHHPARRPIRVRRASARREPPVAVAVATPTEGNMHPADLPRFAGRNDPPTSTALSAAGTPASVPLPAAPTPPPAAPAPPSPPTPMTQFGFERGPR